MADNLRQLIATVTEEACELGIAFDGDGDRIGVVDGAGRILWGDQILMLLARDVLARHPGATVIADVKASQFLFDEIARLGGVPMMWSTGHSLIKAKMAETGALLAGEMSGHVFIADRYFGYDDAIYAAVRPPRFPLALRPDAGGDLRPSAVGDRHARAPVPVRRRAQVRGRRGDRAGCARKGPR